MDDSHLISIFAFRSIWSCSLFHLQEPSVALTILAMASQLDPPGETLIVGEYSYCPSPRSSDHPNPRPDAPPTTLKGPTTTIPPASMRGEIRAGTIISPSPHRLPTFKMQTDDVPSELHISDTHEQISNLTCVPAIPVVESSGFPPATFMEQFRDSAFVTELQELQLEIKKLESLQDCRDMYRRPVFSDCLTLIRSAQKEYLDAKGNPSDGRITWAQLWAETKNQPKTAETEWAWILDQCRKTSLALVYHMCDLANPQDESLSILRDDDSYGIVVDTIVSLCLVMDRANCLYHMGDDASNVTGLVWYRKDAHEILPKHLQNPRGSLMNKRLAWLFDHQVLNERTMSMLQPLTDLALPPRLRPIEP